MTQELWTTIGASFVYGFIFGFIGMSIWRRLGEISKKLDNLVDLTISAEKVLRALSTRRN